MGLRAEDECQLYSSEREHIKLRLTLISLYITVGKQEWGRI